MYNWVSTFQFFSRQILLFSQNTGEMNKTVIIVEISRWNGNSYDGVAGEYTIFLFYFFEQILDLQLNNRNYHLNNDRLFYEIVKTLRSWNIHSTRIMIQTYSVHGISRY